MRKKDRDYEGWQIHNLQSQNPSGRPPGRGISSYLEDKLVLFRLSMDEMKTTHFIEGSLLYSDH